MEKNTEWIVTDPHPLVIDMRVGTKSMEAGPELKRLFYSGREKGPPEVTALMGLRPQQSSRSKPSETVLFHVSQTQLGKEGQ